MLPAMCTCTLPILRKHGARAENITDQVALCMRLESIITRFEGKLILYVQKGGSDHMIVSALSKFSSAHERLPHRQL